jgi:hypothetical protein
MRLITRKELRTLHIATRYHHTINSRLAILRYAEEYGFKGAARRFGVDRKTVRTCPCAHSSDVRTGATPSRIACRRVPRRGRAHQAAAEETGPALYTGAPVHDHHGFDARSAGGSERVGSDLGRQTTERDLGH